MKLHNVTGMTVQAIAMFAVTPAMADNYASDSGSKFTRGLANTVTGWGEVSKNIVNESRDSNVLVGLTYGALKGVAHTVGRTVVGAFDLVTFFAPTREAVHSTYVWQQQRSETTYDIY